MKSGQQISQSELEVMQIIWRENGTITLAPLLERLRQWGKTWKTNTVVTFLARLVEKGFLTTKKQGRNNIYTSQGSEQDYIDSQAEAFLTKMYAGDAKELVASLLNRECLTTDDIVELAEFWKKGRDTV